jgi:hypothetical protein
MTVKDKCMIKFYKNGESLYMHFEQRLVTECLLLYIKKLTLVKSIFNTRGTEGLGLAVGGACLLLLLWVRVLMCTPVTPAVLYMSTGFAGCSVGREISRGACKLVRIPT